MQSAIQKSILLILTIAAWTTSTTGEEGPPPLPPGVEIVNPKDLGISAEEIDKFLGKVNILNNGRNGLKTQIMTVGFDENDKINLQDFQPLSSQGLSGPDKMATELALKGLEKKFGSKIKSQSPRANAIDARPPQPPMAIRTTFNNGVMQGEQQKMLDSINQQLHKEIMETMQEYQKQQPQHFNNQQHEAFKAQSSEPIKTQVAPNGPQSAANGDHTPAKVEAPKPESVNPEGRSVPEQKSYPHQPVVSTPQPLRFPQELVVSGGQTPQQHPFPPQLLLSTQQPPFGQPIFINPNQQQQILGDIQQQGPIVFNQGEQPHSANQSAHPGISFHQTPLNHQHVQFVQGPIFVQKHPQQHLVIQQPGQQPQQFIYEQQPQPQPQFIFPPSEQQPPPQFAQGQSQPGVQLQIIQTQPPPQEQPYLQIQQQQQHFQAQHPQEQFFQSHPLQQQIYEGQPPQQQLLQPQQPSHQPFRDQTPPQQFFQGPPPLQQHYQEQPPQQHFQDLPPPQPLFQEQPPPQPHFQGPPQQHFQEQPPPQPLFQGQPPQQHLQEQPPPRPLFQGQPPQQQHFLEQPPPQPIFQEQPRQEYVFQSPPPPQQLFQDQPPRQQNFQGQPPQHQIDQSQSSPPQPQYVQHQPQEVVYEHRQPTSPTYTTQQTYSLPQKTLVYPPQAHGGNSGLNAQAFGVRPVEVIHKGRAYEPVLPPDDRENSITYHTREQVKYHRHQSPWQNGNELDQISRPPVLTSSFRGDNSQAITARTPPSFFQSDYVRAQQEQQHSNPEPAYSAPSLRSQLNSIKTVSAEYNFYKPREPFRFSESADSEWTKASPASFNSYTPRPAASPDVYFSSTKANPFSSHRPLFDVTPSTPMIRISDPENAMPESSSRIASPALRNLFDQMRSESRSPAHTKTTQGTHYNKNLDTNFLREYLMTDLMDKLSRPVY